MLINSFPAFQQIDLFENGPLYLIVTLGLQSFEVCDLPLQLSDGCFHDWIHVHDEVLKIISLYKPALFLRSRIVEQSSCVLEVFLVEDFLNDFVVELMIKSPHLTDYIGYAQIVVLVEEI